MSDLGKPILCLFLLILAAGCSRQPDLSGEMQVSEAMVRPARMGMNGAAYFTLRNGTDSPDTLAGIDTPVAASAELHRSYEDDEGMSGMRPAGNLPIGSGGTLRLQPGGVHLMLMGMTRELVPGDTVTATLYFARHDSLTVRLPVKATGY